MRIVIAVSLAMALVIAIYAIVTWVSVKLFRIPPAAFVFVFILAIITHNFVDVTRHKLDSLFFQRNGNDILVLFCELVRFLFCRFVLRA